MDRYLKTGFDATAAPVHDSDRPDAEAERALYRADGARVALVRYKPAHTSAERAPDAAGGGTAVHFGLAFTTVRASIVCFCLYFGSNATTGLQLGMGWALKVLFAWQELCVQALF